MPKKYDWLKNARHGRERELEMVIVASLKREKSAQRNENGQQIKKLRRMYNANRIRRDEKMNVRSCEIYTKHLKHSSWIFWTHEFAFAQANKTPGRTWKEKSQSICSQVHCTRNGNGWRWAEVATFTTVLTTATAAAAVQETIDRMKNEQMVPENKCKVT